MIKVVHDGIMCKECVSFSFYIEGWRHKCLQCANYDLCEIHFKYTTHDESHVFATLKQEAEFTPTQLLKPFLTKSPYKNPQQQVRSSSSSKPTESFSLFSPQQNSNDSFFNKSVVGQEKKTNSPPSTFGTPNSGFNFSPSSSSFGPTSTVGTSGASKFLFSSQTSGFGLGLQHQPQPQQQQSKAFDFGMDVQ